MKQWCDVQDQDGFWKIGYIVKQNLNQNIKNSTMSQKLMQNNQNQIKNTNLQRVRIDGYSPSFDTFYCKHSNKIFPVRTYTMGFNSYNLNQNQKIIRQPLTIQELKITHNRLNLIGHMNNLMQTTEQNLRIFMRTQLLILVDKIVRTPFQLINNIKMCDLWINKLFIGIINFYLKILDSSKKFLPLLNEKNQISKDLLLCMYQFSIITKIIIGSHKNSKIFFQSPTNLTIKTDGFIDCFIMSDHDILPFKTFFKNLSLIMKDQIIAYKQRQSIFEVIQFFLDLCQNSRGQLYEVKFLPQTKIVVQQIVNFIKICGALNQENINFLKLKIQILSRLDHLQLKLKIKKVSNLKSQIFVSQKIKKNIQIEKQIRKQLTVQQVSNQQIQSLKQRVQKLQQLLNGSSSNNKMQNHSSYPLKQSLPNEQITQRTVNLGEQQFLSSLNWALACGDLQTCKKLVMWRQNILRLGRIVGWQTALEISIRTIKKAQINHQDIINVNIDMLKRSQEINKIKQEKNNQTQMDPLKQVIIKGKNKNIILQPERD